MIITLSNILDVLVPVIGIVYIFLNCYNKTKVELVSYVAELIALAEKTGLSGPEKMSQVVAEMYKKVPKFLQKTLNEKQLEMIAQWIFSWMRKYANAYMEALQNNETIEDKVDKQTDVVIAEATTELIVEMMNLTEDALREKAIAYGIELDSKDKRDDIIKAIILAVMKKA